MQNKNNKLWEYKRLSSQTLNNFCDGCLALIPPDVDPDILSFGSLLCLVQSMILFYTASSFNLGILLICIYGILDIMSCKQVQRNCNYASHKNELFRYICNSVSMLFLIRIFCISLRIESIWTQYLIINIYEICKMQNQVKQFKEHYYNNYYNKEVFLAVLIIIINRIITSFLGISFTLIKIQDYIDKCLLMVLIYNVCLLIIDLIKDTHFIMRDTVLLCMFIRYMAVYIFFMYNSYDIINLLSVYLHGLFWSLLSTDFIVSKISYKQLNPILPVYALLSSITIFSVPICFTIHYYRAIKSTKL